MLNFSVKYLVKKKKIQKNIILHQKIYTNKKWVKIVIYIVLIKSFNIDNDLYLLKQKIKTFNLKIKLIKIS